MKTLDETEIKKLKGILGCIYIDCHMRLLDKWDRNDFSFIGTRHDMEDAAKILGIELFDKDLMKKFDKELVDSVLDKSIKLP